MLQSIRKYQSPFAIFTLLVFGFTFIPTTSSYALSSGPSQPETQQFAPAGMDNMVDPFSGDFSYNIPLMDVGGYPLNLNYAAGSNADAEASWVGLGWNLNVGAINRTMRGLPDDFKGDNTAKTYYTKPNQTFGMDLNGSVELYGYEVKAPKSVKVGLNVRTTYTYNTYTGIGVAFSVSPKASFNSKQKSPFTASLGIDFSLGSEAGLGITPKAGLSFKQKDDHDETTLGTTLSLPYNSRDGLKGMSLGASFSTKSDNSRSTFGGGNAYLGFAWPAYTPSIQYSSYNVNVSTGVELAFPNVAMEPGVGTGFQYSGQFLNTTDLEVPSYGYLYAADGVDKEYALQDFNREKDGGFTEYTRNLAVPSHTYDVFGVSGQGISGSYRLRRGDVGSIHDVKTDEVTIGPNVGVDLGFGGPPVVVQVGFDAAYQQSNAVSGPFSVGSDFVPALPKFQKTQKNNLAEMVYFKKMGEKSVEPDLNFINQALYEQAMVRPGLITEFGLFDGTVVNLPKDYGDQVSSGKLLKPASNSIRVAREKRTESFISLTAKEATSGGISKTIQNYPFNDVNPSNILTKTGVTEETRVNGNRQDHHLSEIRVTGDNGSRYIYGTPVYNYYQQDVTYSIDSKSYAEYASLMKTGLYPYSTNDDKTYNGNGASAAYNKVVTPAFATSFLLSTILSVDYVDSDNVPGPSDGDLGTYTKFNYSLQPGFKWRTPMSPGNVSFSEGQLSKKSDDKANYSYGEKELRFLHSIETRTHVAKIFLTDRDDALGVVDVSGVINTSVKQKRISKIELYSKADLKNGKTEPIKTAHFEYDYSLCPLTPNSIANTASGVDLDKVTPASNKIQGKLTLKKVWFTYGNSKKGVLNPYVFEYSSENPAYSPKNNDRWGNYKELPAGSPYENNAYFSYVDQNKTNTDKFAAVYALTQIKTPTGGLMKVFYESDDYGYVQDKAALSMVDVVGFTNAVGSYSDFLYVGNQYNDYICVDLGANAISTTEFQNKYLKGLKNVYFSLRTKVISKDGGGMYENATGYADFDLSQSEVQPFNGRYIGYIKTNKVKFKDTDISPMVRAAWMYARMNLQREVYGSSDATDGLDDQILGSIKSLGSTMVSTLALGFDGFMASKNNGNITTHGLCYARLNSPDKKKLGGGHRVKAVIMSDQWNAITIAEDDAFYGQTYTYTKLENGATISAGVALYEPVLGGDENPFRETITVSEKVKWAPPKEQYMEMPFGESYFPSPGVGYSVVTITPVKINQTTIPTSEEVNALPSNGTGTVVHEFYTGKDFPTIARFTDLDTRRLKPSIIAQFMKVGVVDLVTCTQGYYIELNDMHGKPYKESVFSSIDAKKPISYVEHLYKTENGKLINKVDVADESLTITKDQKLGVDVDIIHDQRQYESSTLGGGLHFDLKSMLFGIIPVLVPTGFPDLTDEFTRFRSLVTAKCVNKYAIETGTIAMNDGSVISTENLLWDKATGSVLLTKTTNEFHDLLYNFSYPSHWAYERMGMAADNEGLEITGSNTSLLKDGDEISMANGTIVYANKIGNIISLINRDGSAASNVSGKVVRSGARNMPVSPVGTVSMISNPIVGYKLAFNQVLNAGATEFKEGWQRFCNCPNDINPDPNAVSNPYINGMKGLLRPWKSYTYLTARTQTRLNENVNIRKDGLFSDYTPFWTASTAKLTPTTDFTTSKWQYVTEITKYSPAGMEIENKDALGRYSMAQFGYGRNLPVATSNNSQYRETGYDGFEDYNYGNCNDDHLSWRVNKANLSSAYSHTGRLSIQVPKSSNLEISKVIVPCENPKVIVNTTETSTTWWSKFWAGIFGQ